MPAFKKAIKKFLKDGNAESLDRDLKDAREIIPIVETESKLSNDKIKQAFKRWSHLKKINSNTVRRLSAAGLVYKDIETDDLKKLLDEWIEEEKSAKNDHINTVVQHKRNEENKFGNLLLKKLNVAFTEVLKELPCSTIAERRDILRIANKALEYNEKGAVKSALQRSDISQNTVLTRALKDLMIERRFAITQYGTVDYNTVKIKVNEHKAEQKWLKKAIEKIEERQASQTDHKVQYSQMLNVLNKRKKHNDRIMAAIKNFSDKVVSKEQYDKARKKYDKALKKYEAAKKDKFGYSELWQSSPRYYDERLRLHDEFLKSERDYLKRSSQNTTPKKSKKARYDKKQKELEDFVAIEKAYMDANKDYLASITSKASPNAIKRLRETRDLTRKIFYDARRIENDIDSVLHRGYGQNVKEVFTKMVKARVMGQRSEIGSASRVNEHSRDTDIEQGTTYLSQSRREEEHNIGIKDGEFVRNGRALSTDDMESHDKEGFAAVVLNADGEISVFTHHRMRKESSGEVFAHSSMNAQANVIFGGEIKIQEGKLIAITEHSGHYRPGVMNDYLLLEHFKKSGIDISDTKIYSWRRISSASKTNRDNYLGYSTNAEEFYKACTEDFALLRQELIKRLLVNIDKETLDSGNMLEKLKTLGKEIYEDSTILINNRRLAKAVSQYQNMPELVLSQLNNDMIKLHDKFSEKSVQLQALRSMNMLDLLSGLDNKKWKQILRYSKERKKIFGTIDIEMILSAKDISGNTIVHIAAKKGDTELLELLSSDSLTVQITSDLLQQVDYGGKTPVDYEGGRKLGKLIQIGKVDNVYQKYKRKRGVFKFGMKRETKLQIENLQNKVDAFKTSLSDQDRDELVSLIKETRVETRSGSDLYKVCNEMMRDLLDSEGSIVLQTKRVELKAVVKILKSDDLLDARLAQVIDLLDKYEIVKGQSGLGDTIKIDDLQIGYDKLKQELYGVVAAVGEMSDKIRQKQLYDCLQKLSDHSSDELLKVKIQDLGLMVGTRDDVRQNK